MAKAGKKEHIATYPAVLDPFGKLDSPAAAEGRDEYIRAHFKELQLISLGCVSST